MGRMITLLLDAIGLLFVISFGAVEAFVCGIVGESDVPADENAYIRPVFAQWDGGQVMDSVGEVRFPVFMVEFQDIKYEEDRISPEELEEWIFTGRDSVAGYFATSSQGRLQMGGDVFFYTAQGDMEDYEDEEALEGLILELLEYYDDDIDFSQYDVNGDYVMDSLIISVPRGGDEDFWWGSQHTWYYNWEYEVDGIYLMNYIVNDEQPYQNCKKYFLGTLEHELGHCMGLPDYYKYNDGGMDFEGMSGVAGKERMDDSEGDFCQFSKLQLGWLKREQVQIMPGGADRATFYLPPVKDGGCLLIFERGKKPNFQGEYFVVEYNTPEGLQKGLFRKGGVRILHVQAEVIEDEYGYYEYKYNNFSPYYDESNEGIRVLKLVNDGKGFFQEGDVVTFENTGGEDGNFGWYTEEGGIRPPGFGLRVGELQENGFMEVEVLWDTE